MRTRLLTGAVAVTMAMTMVVGGTARPAKAAWQAWAAIAITVAQNLFGGGGGSGDLERAKREIIDAVNASRQEMLDHIDDIANADVRACTEASTALVAQIDLMDEFTLGAFVIDAVDCAYLSTAYFDAVQNPAAADNIGKLMGSIYSIAMVGFAKLGFPTVDLLSSLIRGYEAVEAKLAPTCTEETIVERDSNGRPLNVDIFYRCVAYNGDRAEDIESYYRNRMTMGPIDRPATANQATRNTSRAIAQQALPTLRQLRAAMP